MKKGTNKLVYGILATSLVLGAGVATLKYSPVYAADTSATDTQIQAGNVAKEKSFGQHDRGRDGDKGRNHKGAPGGHTEFELHPGNKAEELAAVLGIDTAILMEELKHGKTIAQVAQEKAGLTKEVLLQKLTDAATKKLDASVADGKLKAEEATKLKAGLADRLNHQIDSTKPMGKGGQGDHKGKGHDGRPGGFGPLGSPETLTKVLGVTEQELMDARKAGKSISELAKEKGIDEATLIAKLKDEMTAPLQKFVQHKGNPKLQSPNAAAPAPTKNP